MSHTKRAIEEIKQLGWVVDNDSLTRLVNLRNKKINCNDRKNSIKK
mgnify:CR=1 FL=1